MWTIKYEEVLRLRTTVYNPINGMGNKGYAFAAVRKATGCDLRTCKHFIENDYNHPDIHIQHDTVASIFQEMLDTIANLNTLKNKLNKAIADEAVAEEV